MISTRREGARRAVLRIHALLGSMMSACALLTPCAYAQTAGTPSDAASDPKQQAGLNEIIVVAQKRSQRITDVGISITASTADQLQSAGVADIASLTKAVPGFSASKGFSGVPVFGLRGLSFDAPQLAASPTVSVYVDEAPLPYSALTGGVTLDLERVEVLKGPQGTLFGNNATGGAINFIAAKPTERLSAGLKGSVDRFGQIFAEGYVSGPLSSTLRARLAVSTTQGGDWQKSYTPGPKLKWGSANKGAERLILEWRPEGSDALVSLNLNHGYDKSDPQMPQLHVARPQFAAFPELTAYPLPPKDNRAADFTVNGAGPRFERNDEQYQAALRAEIPLSGVVKATVLANYAHLDTYYFFDQDGTRIDSVEGGRRGTIETYGMEARVNADLAEIGLNLMAGGTYSKDNIHEQQPFYHVNSTPVPAGLFLNPIGHFTSKTAAAFANADWKFTEKLTLTAGVRYTSVKQTDESCDKDPGTGAAAATFGGIANLLRSFYGLGPTSAYMTGECATIGPAPDFLPFNYQASGTDHNVSWRAGLNFKPDRDTLIYGLISRGFKAGGYPFTPGITSDQYGKVKQERVTAYEVGAKAANRQFTLSAAAFYYQYDNKQLYLLENSIIGYIVFLRNAAKSKAYGFEFDGSFKPVEPLTLRAALTYSHTEVTEPGNINPSDGRPSDRHQRQLVRLCAALDGNRRRRISDSSERRSECPCWGERNHSQPVVRGCRKPP